MRKSLNALLTTHHQKQHCSAKPYHLKRISFLLSYSSSLFWASFGRIRSGHSGIYNNQQPSFFYRLVVAIHCCWCFFLLAFCRSMVKKERKILAHFVCKLVNHFLLFCSSCSIIIIMIMCCILLYSSCYYRHHECLPAPIIFFLLFERGNGRHSAGN